MAEGIVSRLAQAIGYPEPVGAGQTSFAFQVDGYEIEASVDAERLLLKYVMDVPEESLLKFAGFAAGRMLKEDATLAYDPSSDKVFLWQPVSGDANLGVLRGAFERFAHSCDWWRARINEIGNAEPEFPEVMIRP